MVTMQSFRYSVSGALANTLFRSSASSFQDHFNFLVPAFKIPGPLEDATESLTTGDPVLVTFNPENVVEFVHTIYQLASPDIFLLHQNVRIISHDCRAL
jgi:hypothetical protein